MIRFDAYSATTTSAKKDDLMQVLFDAGGVSGVAHLKQGKGFFQFAERLSVKDDSGHEWASLMWGGAQGDRLMIEAKGERTPAVVEALRGGYAHRCTRVDSCADFDAPRAFEKLYRACRKVKLEHRIIGGKHGDWEDFPEKGRTLYLGATSSVTRLRLYEKGKQAEYQHLDKPNWTRLEVQVRPAKDAKDEYSKLSASEVWGASRWSRELAEKVLGGHVDPHPAGTLYRLTDAERSLRALCKQYGGTLTSLAESLGGWELVGQNLQICIEQIAREKRGDFGAD